MSWFSKLFMPVLEDRVPNCPGLFIDRPHLDDEIDEQQRTLGQLHDMVVQEKAAYHGLRADVARLRMAHDELDALPTTKKLRDRIEAQSATIRWQSERLQEALRDTEDLKCEMKLQNEGMICVASGKRTW